MAVQSQDIASLFKELEDASKLAKLENFETAHFGK